MGTVSFHSVSDGQPIIERGPPGPPGPPLPSATAIELEATILPQSAVFIDSTLNALRLGDGLTVGGLIFQPVFGVEAWRFREALMDAGALQDVLNNLDPGTYPQAINRWTTNANVVEGDPQAAWVQGTLGYTDAQMADLFTAAKAI